MANTTITQAITKTQLIHAFRELGVHEGMVLEVHSSLKSLGWVVGGAQTVVDALLDAVGYNGTIVMPLQDANNTEPSRWTNPPISVELFDVVRQNMPAFMPEDGDCFNMGAVVDNFRRRQGVYVSRHPNMAFVAYGKYAKLICARHRLDYGLSKSSPLGQLNQLNAFVLLIGVDYTNCTGMHLGEYRSGVRPIVLEGAAVDTETGRQWKKYIDIELDSDEFNEPGQILEDLGKVLKCQIGQAMCRLFPLRDAVEQTSLYLQNKYGYEKRDE